MITGAVNSSFFSIGFLSISSIFEYLDFISAPEPSDVASVPFNDNGNAAAARPPATVAEMNLRRDVFISKNFTGSL
jgi:hypothetical protein